MSDFRIVAAGDAAWLVEWPARIDPELNSRAVSLADRARRLDPAVRDAVVGYCSATVYFDPLRIDGTKLELELRRIASELPATTETNRTKEIAVGVCYGDEFGPDLADVAGRAGISEADVIALHAGRTYRVYMVGFIPGFPYMASVDERLALPRRASPRLRVPAGSVAIAAGQTGIYPRESPGGWHLIGRTRVKPFDASGGGSFMFRPGDRVRFHPIDRAKFEGTA
jgi:KipI family sensor histidine kinase inhibitor